ncbi:MAG: hypothetical protein ACW981_19110 [Candidatus Hodarchaeales archaeon]|jgi:hypothetical protein
MISNIYEHFFVIFTILSSTFEAIKKSINKITMIEMNFINNLRAYCPTRGSKIVKNFLNRSNQFVLILPMGLGVITSLSLFMFVYISYLGRFILIGEADTISWFIFVIFLILMFAIIFIFLIYEFFVIYRHNNNKELIIQAKREVNTLLWRKK